MSPSPWPERRIDVGPLALNVVELGEGPAVLLMHGWPEFHLSWRHQIPALADAGYRVIAPDFRGFNRSDAPTAREAYLIDALVGDMRGLLDALGLRDAVFVGHDWGGWTAWHAALTIPDRVRAVVSLNTPHRARTLMRPTQEFRRLPDGRFNYALAMLEPNAPEARFMADLAGTLTTFIRGAAFDASFWTDEVCALYVEAYRRSGMHSVNLYRCWDDNWMRAKSLRDQRVLQPAMMVAAVNDPVLLPSMTAGMQQLVPNLRMEFLDGCGHWTQQEKPAEVTALLLDFLAGLSRE